MDDSWYDELDGLGLAAAIRTGDVTATEVVEAAIQRIETRNPAVNAVVATRFDAARAEAIGFGGRRPVRGGPLPGEEPRR